MSGDLDTRLFDLAAAIEQELDLDATLDFLALGARFAVPPTDVERVVVALRAVQQALGEDLERTPLTPPDLPADYELGAELGRGGMGVVYRAHQRSLDRDVAVKVLRPGDLAFGPAIARFEREAKSLARLRHRHIVTVHEVGRVNGHVYFTMDLVEGKSLQRAIADREMTATRAVRLVRQICSAMVYAHQKGVVHRDLKPANVLVDHNDDAFVCDFGLARDLGDGHDATLSGQIVGTPAYMSPEQALGDKARISEASDVYAIGAILYECLAGQPPFHGLPLAKLMHAVVADEPVALRKRNPRVPRDLAVICGKAMQKRIADRYATVQALSEDLERFASGKEILARPRPLPVRAVRFASRHRGAVVAAALPVLAAVAAMWWFVVPELVQRHHRDLGDRLHAEGNLEGARYAYAEAGLALPKAPADPDARCTRYADCLVAEAGRLLAAGHAERAQELASSALALVPSADDLRTSPALLEEQQIAERHDAWYVGQKASVLLDGRWDAGFGLDVLTPRIVADLSQPRPEAAALLAAGLAARGEELLPRLGGACAPWITTLLGMRANLPAPHRNRLDRLCRGSSMEEFAYRDMGFEQALVGLVRDRGLDVEARKDAAALLDRFGSFPFVQKHVRKDHANGFSHEPVIRDEDLEELVVRYDSLSGLDRAVAYDRCIGFVVATLSRPQPDPAAADAKSTNPELRNWLQDRTGSHPRRDEDAAAWWEGIRAVDPRARLLAALKWDVRPSELTPALLLQAFRGPAARSSAYAQAWIHGLLVLTVADGTRVPFRSQRTGDLAARWDRALHALPGDRYTLRLATLGFVDGAPEPRILWHQDLPIGIDETVRWNERVTPQLGGLTYHLGLRRDRMPMPSPWLAVLGQAKLEWTGDGVRGRIGHSQTALLLAARNGQYRHDNDLYPGRVTVADAAWFGGKDGEWHIDLLTLATVVPAAAATTAWTATDWHAAVGASIEELAKAGEVPVLNALPIAVAAAFLPLGSHRDALLAIDAIAARSPFGAELNCVEERRRARLLAGDPTALDLPITPAFAEDGNASSAPGRTSFLVRLALATDLPAMRDHAFLHLQRDEMPSAFARTLATAIAAGTEAPTWLAERVRATPGRFATFVGSHVPQLTGLVLLAGATIGLLAAALRRRGRHTAAVLFFAGLGLGQCSLVLGDVEFSPPWPGYAVTIVAVWVGYWRIVRGWLWWLAPLWWSATAVLLAFATPDRQTTGVLLTVAVALHVCIRWRLWRQRRASGEERFAAQRLRNSLRP